jgi:tetratricopeptide (TPR) repeat protein
MKPACQRRRNPLRERVILGIDELDTALRHHRQGNLSAATAIYEKLLPLHPGNADIHRHLGVVRLQMGDLSEAERLLMRAASLAPRSLHVLSDLGALRLAQERFRDAVQLLETVLRADPNHVDALNHCGIAWTEMAHVERAAPLFERLTRLRPSSVAALRQLGECQYKLGQLDEALEAFQRALELSPDDRQSRLALGDAYESLGRLREARAQYMALLRRNPESPLALARLLMLGDYEPDASWISQARDIAESDQVRPEPRARVSIALAHHYDRTGRYDEAFRFLERGNSLLRAQRPYDVARFGEAIDRLIEVFTAEQIRDLQSRFSSPSDRPIFIVGMPRSGTTLVEQMLGSHSQVEAGGELSTMLNVAARVRGLVASGADYPYGVRQLDSRGLDDLAQIYLRRLERVSPTAPRVTDKLPFNFMHVGLIAALFPRATIVHCKRDPLDTCVSCYFTSFAEQIRFASDMKSLGQYYRHYQRLMLHWHAVLPGSVLDVCYEDLVQDTEPLLGSLLAHCRLEWESECLRFYSGTRSIRTPSRWQVRKPISTASVGRWIHYAEWITPLRQALERTT